MHSQRFLTNKNITHNTKQYSLEEPSERPFVATISSHIFGSPSTAKTIIITSIVWTPMPPVTIEGRGIEISKY